MMIKEWRENQSLLTKFLMVKARGVEDLRSGYHAPVREFGTLIGPRHIQFGSQLPKF
jgi:hypothetical protein